MTDQIDLDAIRARAAAATDGPWRQHDTDLAMGGHTATVLHGKPGLGSAALIAWLPTMRHDVAFDDGRNAWKNAEFIAAARQDVPALLDEVDRLRAALKEIAFMTKPLSADYDFDGVDDQIDAIHEKARQGLAGPAVGSGS